MKTLAFLALLSTVGCASLAPTVVHPSPRAQAVSKCLAAEDAGLAVPACAPLAADVAALRKLSAMAAR